MDKNKKTFNSKTLKYGSRSIAVTVIAIAVVAVINLIVSALPVTYTHFNTDVVDMYELSETSRKLVGGVTEEINVYYVAVRGAEDSIIEEMLSRYAALSGKIKVKNVDPSEEPLFVSKYTDDKDAESDVVIFESAKRSKVIKSYEIYYEVSDNTYFLAEGAFTGAVDFVTRDKLPKVYYLTGHDETLLGEGYLDAIKDENITIEELNLLTKGDIPEDCEALLILSPMSDISTNETDKIMSFMDRGGDVVLVTDPVKFSVDRFPNLASVARKAGLEAIEGLVVDMNRMISEDSPYAFVPEIVASQKRVTSKLGNTNVNIMWAASHGIKEIDGGAEAIITPIIKTSSKGIVQVDDEEFYENNTDGMTVYVGAQSDLAVTGENLIDAESSFIWYASPTAIYEDFTVYWNDELFVATLNYLCDSSVSLSLIPKSWEVEPLIMTSTAKNLWSIVFTAVIPLAFIGGGLAVWYKRRKK